MLTKFCQEEMIAVIKYMAPPHPSPNPTQGQFLSAVSKLPEKYLQFYDRSKLSPEKAQSLT